MSGKHGPAKERFERHYTRGPKSQCWLWTGALNEKGYGSFRDKGKSRTASRVAYEIHKRRLVPKGRCVCHSCDTPACVNPHHLFLGSHQKNMTDRNQKGRARGPLGEANATTSLTEKQVRAIRHDRRKLREIAVDYGMSLSGIHGVRSGVTWKHVQEPIK
jgi:hypothetical protein